MKKIYQTPAVSVTSVSTQQMMALSFSKGDTGSDGTVLSRRDNEWGDIWGSGDEEPVDEEW